MIKDKDMRKILNTDIGKEAIKKMTKQGRKYNISSITVDEFLAKHDSKSITINPYNFSTFNPLEPDNFTNPYSHEETLKRIQKGGFDDYYDFLNIVMELQKYNVEIYKKWWLKDATKNSALIILSEV